MANGTTEIETHDGEEPMLFIGGPWDGQVHSVRREPRYYVPEVEPSTEWPPQREPLARHEPLCQGRETRVACHQFPRKRLIGAARNAKIELPSSAPRATRGLEIGAVERFHLSTAPPYEASI